MRVWIDAQLSPALASWFSQHFNVQAFSVKWLGLPDAKDREIFFAARKALAVVMTKDSDFIRLLDQYGPPPQLIWISAGNTCNARMKEILQHTFPSALALLQANERLVEISDI